MHIDLGLLIGLIAIALAIFFGLRELPKRLSALEKTLTERLSALEKTLTEKLSTLERNLTERLSTLEKNLTERLSTLERNLTDRLSGIEKSLTEINTKLSSLWDIAARSQKPTTIERTLGNLGKVKITAEPYKNETVYIIEAEKVELKDGWIERLREETGLASKEREIFGTEPRILSLTPNRLIVHLPSTEPKACIDYLTLFLKWLDSTYFESLERIKEFEEPILRE